MNISNIDGRFVFVPLYLSSADGTWAMSVSLGYLSHAKKEIQNVHELVHAHRLSVGIAFGVHNAITVHIKKPKIFKEMSHVKGNLTYCS